MRHSWRCGVAFIFFVFGAAVAYASGALLLLLQVQTRA